MTTVYTLMIEELPDTAPDSETGLAYRVTIAENGLEKGDGVALELAPAINEALREAGIL